MAGLQRGRCAAVTGGASGIGFAVAANLAGQGWRVALLDRDAGPLARAGERLRAEGADVLCMEADVTDEKAMEWAFADIEKHFGSVQGLVTSAGIAADIPFLETSVEEFRRINDINVVGTFIAARAAAMRMRVSGGGSIVTISSVSGILGNAGRSAYGASKGAVVNLSRVMAVELARYGIRVNSVAPGPVETPLVAAVHTQAVRRQWHEQVPMERYAAPEEIAEAVAFLLDDRASYITGQILAVDGGFAASGLNGKGDCLNI